MAVREEEGSKRAEEAGGGADRPQVVLVVSKPRGEGGPSQWARFGSAIKARGGGGPGWGAAFGPGVSKSGARA
eukprot:4158084-Prymnesium_polylepis.1